MSMDILPFHPAGTCLRVNHDSSLTYQPHLEKLKMMLSSCIDFIGKLTWTSPLVLLTSVLALMSSSAEHCSVVWKHNHHSQLVKTELNLATHIISGCLIYTLTSRLYVLLHVAPPDIWQDAIIVLSAWRSVTGDTNIFHLWLSDALFSSRKQHAEPTQRSAHIQG